jgi:hypothetical protein
MNDKFQTANTEPEKPVEETTPVREPDIELTPKAKAKAANKLPRAEQLEKFEQHLEAHDSGNQPA